MMQSFTVMEEIAAMLSIAMAVFHAIHKSKFAFVWAVASLMALVFSVYSFPTQILPSINVAAQPIIKVKQIKKSVVHTTKSQSFVNQMLLQVFDALKTGRPIPPQYAHLISPVDQSKMTKVQYKTVALPVKEQIRSKNPTVKTSVYHAPVSHVVKKVVTISKPTVTTPIIYKRIPKKLAMLAANSLVSSVLHHSTQSVRNLFAKRYAQVYKQSKAQDIYAMGYSIVTVHYLHNRANFIKIDMPSLLPTGLSKKHWENTLRQLAGMPLSKWPIPTHESALNETWSNVYQGVAQLTFYLDMSTNEAYLTASS